MFKIWYGDILKGQLETLQTLLRKKKQTYYLFLFIFLDFKEWKYI